MKIALFPGSFDPFTNGHLNIVQRSLAIFDRVVIGIGKNSTKTHQESDEKRKEKISAIFSTEPRVQVAIFDTLTVDFAKEIGAKFIVRGVRNAADFEYEQQIAYVNQKLANIETVLLIADSEMTKISSSIVRELQAYGKDVADLVPNPAKE